MLMEHVRTSWLLLVMLHKKRGGRRFYSVVVLLLRFKHLPPSEIVFLPTRNKDAESNLKTLSKILNQLQGPRKVVSYTCLARITKIEGGWYYESCVRCTQRARQCGHQYYCPTHGVQDEHSYRYKFVATLADDSCTKDAVFFDAVVTTLVGKTCFDLITSQTSNDPKQLPPQLEDLINKPFIFEVHMKNDNQTKAITVNNAFEAPPFEVEANTSSTTALATPSVKTPKRAREQDAEARQKQKAKKQ